MFSINTSGLIFAYKEKDFNYKVKGGQSDACKWN